MKRAVVVAGLAFGDEGKGSLVDFLVRRYGAQLVVRYNGGPQAAHNVVTDEGVHHTFSQFGSGTLAGARTFLSRHMLVDPLALAGEADVLVSKGCKSPLSLIHIDPACTVITPWHRMANRIREAARGAARHGSVGLGIGEARRDALNGYVFHAGDGDVSKLEEICELNIEYVRPFATAQPHLFQEMQNIRPRDVLDDYLRILGPLSFANWRNLLKWRTEIQTVVFEGAQGVLLDETHGFAPYNTWTDCTFRNADALIQEAGIGDVLRVGVLRSYFTRHGAGPFPTEMYPGLPEALSIKEAHNGAHPFMGEFRVGSFDAVLADYAVRCCPGIDCLAVTHLDSAPSNLVCESYTGWDGSFTAESLAAARPVYRVAESLIGRISEIAPVRFESRGPRAGDKTDRGEVRAAVQSPGEAQQESVTGAQGGQDA